MVSAEEMRRKTELGLKKRAEKTLGELWTELEKSAAVGEYEILYRGTLTQEAVSTLREMGYKVKYCSGEFDDFGNYYSGYFSISWRKRKRFVII